MNETTWTLAIHVATTLIIRQQTMASRMSLLGAVLRELGRSIRARLSGQGYREQAALDFVRDRAIAGDAQSVLNALDQFSREQRFLMNLGERKGAILDGLVAKLPADSRILELGGYCGYSAVRMARLLGEEGQVVSIETNRRHARIARAICRFAGVEDRVQILVGEASAVIPTLTGPFDLMLMDHNKEEYLIDLWRIEEYRLLEPGSTVVADNVGPLFDVRAYLEYVRHNAYLPYDSRYAEAPLEYQEDLLDGMEISVWQGRKPDQYFGLIAAA